MSLRDVLERWRAPIYLVTVVLAAVLAWRFDDMQVLEVVLNPALALMLYVTFLQDAVDGIACGVSIKAVFCWRCW